MINAIPFLAVTFTMGICIFGAMMAHLTQTKTNRMRRLHYSLFILFLLPVFITAFMLGMSETFTDNKRLVITALATVGSFAIIFSITVSRLHDINSGGWVSLLLFIPVINILLIIALMFANGTVGTNRFGENPKLKGTAPLNTQD